MLIKRRKFLQSGSLATAGTLLLPKFLKASAMEMPAELKNKILVVIQLSGGNDGLNTIIPVRNDIYYKKRPRLAFQSSAALTLTDEASIHPALKTLKAYYDSGDLTILNSVGYPNPDRSHFRSMDIWHTASGSNEYWNTGWLGRYLDATCGGCDVPTQVLEVDDVLSLALKGAQHKGLALTDPRKLKQSASGNLFPALANDAKHDHEPLADYLYKTLADTLQSADYLQQCSKNHLDRKNYPDTDLGRSLRTVSSLILGDANTRVFYTSLGSFDTHINQQPAQNRLFEQLDAAIKAFVDDMKNENRYEDIAIVTFSEFGRRVAQNASGGTDHGTANNMFIIGKQLAKPGLFNNLPDLENLKDGDLQFQVDFRQVYASLLSGWLQTPHQPILKEKFAPLPLFLA